MTCLNLDLHKVREELVSLTPNNAILVGEVMAVLSKERLAELLRDKNALDARQVQVMQEQFDTCLYASHSRERSVLRAAS